MYNANIDIDLLSNLIRYNHDRYISFRDNLPFIPNRDYERLLNCRHQKKSRIRRRLVFLLARFNHVWFCTFTFNNNYINKSTRTKRDIIKSVLNTHDFLYILNVDYGLQNHREHYHCIVATNLDFDVNQYFQEFYSGGFSLSIECKTRHDDFERLIKYLSKLTNHCVKSTTTRQRIVYNFHGYDILYPTYREQSIAYFKDCLKLFEDTPT